MASSLRQINRNLRKGITITTVKSWTRGHLKLMDFGNSMRFLPVAIVHKLAFEASIKDGRPFISDERRKRVQLYQRKSMSDDVGNIAFMPPEVVKPRPSGLLAALKDPPPGTTYTFACDFWSVGVTLFYLLFGTLPFDGATTEEIRNKIMNWRKHLKFPLVQSVSDEAKDLIKRLLCDEPSRLGLYGCEDVMSHVFFEGTDWRGLRDHSMPVPYRLATEDDKLTGTPPKLIVDMMRGGNTDWVPAELRDITKKSNNGLVFTLSPSEATEEVQLKRTSSSKPKLGKLANTLLEFVRMRKNRLYSLTANSSLAQFNSAKLKQVGSDWLLRSPSVHSLSTTRTSSQLTVDNVNLHNNQTVKKFHAVDALQSRTPSWRSVEAPDASCSDLMGKYNTFLDRNSRGRGWSQKTEILSYGLGHTKTRTPELSLLGNLENWVQNTAASNARPEAYLDYGESGSGEREKYDTAASQEPKLPLATSKAVPELSYDYVQEASTHDKITTMRKPPWCYEQGGELRWQRAADWSSHNRGPAESSNNDDKPPPLSHHEPGTSFDVDCFQGSNSTENPDTCTPEGRSSNDASSVTALPGRRSSNVSSVSTVSKQTSRKLLPTSSSRIVSVSHSSPATDLMSLMNVSRDYNPAMDSEDRVRQWIEDIPNESRSISQGDLHDLEQQAVQNLSSKDLRRLSKEKEKMEGQSDSKWTSCEII